MKKASLLITGIALIVSLWPARLRVAAFNISAHVLADSHDLPASEDERGLVALDQTYRELANPFTVMAIAATPDDVDEGTLGYYHKKLGARTVILHATRGESGERATRGELNRALGLIRTREAMAAARALGADIYFLNLADYGYAKSAEEVLAAWGHDDALQRLVRAIRAVRPDAMLINSDARSSDGQQQALARLAAEAFKAAADPKAFPDPNAEAWQAWRLFQRTTTADATVSINLDELDATRGRTYAEIGLAARHQLESYTARSDRLTPERQQSDYRLVTAALGDTLKTGGGLLDGIELSEKLKHSLEPPRPRDLPLLNALTQRDRVFEALQEKLAQKRAEGSVTELHARYGAEFFRVVRYTQELEKAMALVLGLSLKVTITDPVVVPGQKLTARVCLRNDSQLAFPVIFHTPEQLPIPSRPATDKRSEVMPLQFGGQLVQEIEYDTKDAPPSLPHADHLYDEDYYALGSALPDAQPAAPFGNRLIVSAEIGLGQVSFTLAAVARFDIAPAVELSTIPFAFVKDWETPREIEFPVRVRNRTPGALDGALWIVPLALHEEDYEPAHISFAREDEEATIRVKLRLPLAKPPLSTDILIEFRREKPAPPDPLGTAHIAVKTIDLTVADNLKVGFVRGMDSSLAFALDTLGVTRTELSPDDINRSEHGNGTQAAQTLRGCGDLTRFDTIIVGAGAYFARPELASANRCLLRYVRQGGNLLVLAQRAADWNLLAARQPFAPFLLKLSDERIGQANVTAKILDPEHPLMAKPNKLTASDFDGWVIARALGLPREWATEYTALLESSDAGEDPKKGGLLVARYGEGSFIYTTFNWSPQWSNGNAGAYRALANFVSLPKVGATPLKRQ